MTTAIVTAGGSGSRTGLSVPKQFVTVFEKPVIIYTLENLQSLKEIDNILVVVPQGWESFVDSYCKQYGISKLLQIVYGGDTRTHSFANALKSLENKIPQNEMIVLIDANRPLMPHSVILDAMRMAKIHGASVALDASTDTLFIIKRTQKDKEKIGEIIDTIDRNIVFRGQNPECSTFQMLHHIYSSALSDNLPDMSASLYFLHYGYKVVPVQGSPKNFKITTSDDLEIFRAYVSMKYKN